MVTRSGARGDGKEVALKLLVKMLLILVGPQLALAQWTEGQTELLQSAEGKIGPAGPKNHADRELEIRPLRHDN